MFGIACIMEQPAMSFIEQLRKPYTLFERRALTVPTVKEEYTISNILVTAGVELIQLAINS